MGRPPGARRGGVEVRALDRERDAARSRPGRHRGQPRARLHLDAATNDRVRALDGGRARPPVPGLREAVPTYRSLLVVYDPARAGFGDVRAALLEIAQAPLSAPPRGRRIEVPVAYGRDDGPDLQDVARSRGLDVAEVVARHAATDYTALMLGFTPGFAYLGLLPGIARDAAPRDAARERAPRVRRGSPGARRASTPPPRGRLEPDRPRRAPPSSTPRPSDPA